MADATLNQLLLDGLRRYDRPDRFRYKRDGRWQTMSADEFRRRAAGLAQTLARLGVEKGDRVAVFSENRPEWHIADLAILGRGAITVPLYPAESSDRAHYILLHSEAKVAFVSGKPQFEKMQAVWKQLPALATVIPLVPVAAAEGRRVLAWEAAAPAGAGEDEVREFERRAQEARPDDVASLIYTSGTTGTPKGALLTQRNFASNVSVFADLLPVYPSDLALSMLPFCHIYERTNAYRYLTFGVDIAYGESFDKVVENLRDVRPTVMAAVPRFFEKLYAGIQETVLQMPAAKRAIFEWAVRVGREALPYRLAGKPLPAGLALRYRLAELMVYRRVHQEVGGRIRSFISGGAPLARELNEFFHALGFTIYEGYGLTETSPVIAVNVPRAVKLGTVGRPIPGVEVTIAEDGEILTRGPQVMKGYYKMEAETLEALEGGWFHTGDVGFLDADGFLTITDRKKDLIKTAGGKMIAPQPVENQLKQSPYIQNAVVVGDRRKYAVALLVPNLGNLDQFARQEGLGTRSREELLAHPRVRALLEAAVGDVNRRLAQFEQLKRFAVLPEEFSFDNGQLTYTQKVRRRKIEEHYRGVIDDLYREERQPVA